MVNGLECFSVGMVMVNGCDVGMVLGVDLCGIWCEVGMIFQYFNLFVLCMVVENIVLLFEIVGQMNIVVCVVELIEWVGLIVQVNCYLVELLGGQKQCVGIVCVLVIGFKVLFLDEVILVLDFDIMWQVLDLLVWINCDLGLMILFIIYEMVVVCDICSYVVVIENGQIVELGEIYVVFLCFSYLMM